MAFFGLKKETKHRDAPPFSRGRIAVSQKKGFVACRMRGMLHAEAIQNLQRINHTGQYATLVFKLNFFRTTGKSGDYGGVE